MIAYALAALVALSVAFGSGWHYGAKGPTARLKALEAQVQADNARRVAIGKIREAEDERAGLILRAREAESFAALRLAEARAAAAGDAASALAAQLRAAGVGGTLPGAARSVFNDAVGAGGGRAAQVRPPAPDAAAVAGGAAGAGQGAADGVEARQQDAEPVECVTVFEVGARNSARALFNAALVMSCQREQIALWEACTGQQYPTSASAPWLVKQP